MDDRFHHRYGAALLVLALLVIAPATPAAEPLSLEQAVSEALGANPALAAMKMQAQARQAVPAQQGTLPDPLLTLEPGRAAMAQFKVGLVQPLPYPGKLGLRSEAAEQLAEASQHGAAESALGVAAGVKQGWWRLFYLDRALEILRRNQEVMRQLISVTETRYRVGQGLQQDLLLAQLELSRLLEAEIGLNGQHRAAEARLNALMNRPVTQQVILPPQVGTELPAVADEAHLLALASRSRPQLAAQRAQVEAARTGVKLARKDYRPDFMVGANYEWREGREDMKSIMFAMSLPLRTGQRQDKALDQRNAELLAQRYTLSEQEIGIAADVAAARADYERNREQARLLKDGILPQASQTVASMLAAYQVGKVDFLNLARSQSTLYDYETRYWQSVSEAQAALARLIATVGEENIHE